MPSLHIGLGVFKKLYDQMEIQANHIDGKIYAYKVRQGNDSDDEDDDRDQKATNFDQAIQRRIDQRIYIKGQLERKQEDLEDLFDEIPLAGLKKKKKEVVSEMLTEIGKVQQDIEELV